MKLIHLNLIAKKDVFGLKIKLKDLINIKKKMI